MIARRLDEPIHRIEHVIRSRGIEPIGKAGNLRVFDDHAIEVIAEILRDIDTKRDRNEAAGQEGDHVD
jgi:hypothetical protein